ncbi:hypothetical protein AAFP35_24280 [Gordonia sp. CPCC 206044]|uniref:hypothetical protein n=1 Tax=Gordonia sp. CPCC 206044 TaxID=3140793 RepID=UPI003AF3BD42
MTTGPNHPEDQWDASDVGWMVRTTDLGDVGLQDHYAAETIHDDGRRRLWVADFTDFDKPGRRTSLGAPQPPAHERLGPLPDDVHHRVLAAAFRCGAPCADGHPCRIAVSAPAHRCGWHRRQRP